jgi:hypothetical protein
MITPVALVIFSVPAPVRPAAAATATDCSAASLLPGRFPSEPQIDNRFLPYTPGMQFTLSGSVIEDDGSVHPHQVVTTVTDLSKVMAGVRTIVIYDVDIQDGVVQESELFFVAQRSDGSVWTLGEYPEEYDNGKLAGAPSTWIAGIQDARAGKAMLAQPKVGTPTYLQGFSPLIQFKDCASVVKTNQTTCVATGCYGGVLVVDEFAPFDLAGGHQLKYHAPGVGVIKVAAAGGVDPEALQLTQAAKLCAAEFAAVLKQVIAQDKRGYHVARSIYGATTQAERTLTVQTC